MVVMAFQPKPTLGDPLIEAVDHCQIAVVDFALAVQHAQSADRAMQIRRQINARILELQAVESMALAKMDDLPFVQGEK